MKKNIGSIDRIIRVVLGILFIGLFLTDIVTGGWGILLLAVGIVFIGTSLISRCPLYLPFGISSRKKSRH